MLRMGRRCVARVSIRRSPAHTTSMCTYMYVYVYMYMYTCTCTCSFTCTSSEEVDPSIPFDERKRQQARHDSSREADEKWGKAEGRGWTIMHVHLKYACVLLIWCPTSAYTCNLYIDLLLNTYTHTHTHRHTHMQMDPTTQPHHTSIITTKWQKVAAAAMRRAFVRPLSPPSLCPPACRVRQPGRQAGNEPERSLCVLH